MADEPTGSLDEQSSSAVFELLLDLVATEGVTLVMATHDRALAGRCDRLLEMHDGRIHEPVSPDAHISTDHAPRVVACAAWHSLLWLVIANAIGVLLAALLLFPALNRLLGEWTYGRWIIAHMNLELYGWSSLPMAGFLFRVYGADRGAARAMVQAGSMGVVRGAWCGRLLLALRPLQRQALS